MEKHLGMEENMAETTLEALGDTCCIIPSTGKLVSASWMLSINHLSGCSQCASE